MTVTITKPPPALFHATCRKCGAQFSYALSDLRALWSGGEHVFCPTCETEHRHPDQRLAALATRLDTAGLRQPQDATSGVAAIFGAMPDIPEPGEGEKP